MKKRIFSLLIALLLCLTALPALADSAPEVRYSTDGGATWTSDSLMNALWNSYGKNTTVKMELLRDITLDSNWYAQQDLVYGNIGLELDGKGHTIQRTQGAKMLFCVRYDGTVTLKNVIIDGGAVWSSDDPATRTNTGLSLAGNNAHLIYVDGGATLILESETILQNSDLGATSYGGAVVVGYSDAGSGKLIMKDGAIIRNNRADSGGGVYVMGPSDVFEMQGGEISGNYASGGGGGVCSAGQFTLKDGKISGNASGNNGGGMTVLSGGVTLVEGGSITNNRSTVGGGGVTALAGSVILKGGEISQNSITGGMGGGMLVYSGSLTVSGDPVVSGNSASTGVNNIYLASGKTIKVDGDLSSGAELGVTTAVSPVEGSPVNVTGVNNADYKDRFSSDNPHYVELNSADNVVQLGYATVYTVTTAESVNGSVSPNPASAAAGKTIKLIATPVLGYRLDSLTVTDAAGNAVEVINNSFTMPASNVTVEAVFVEAPVGGSGIPDTGDGFSAALWLSLLAIGALGMMLMRRRRA